MSEWWKYWQLIYKWFNVEKCLHCRLKIVAKQDVYKKIHMYMNMYHVCNFWKVHICVKHKRLQEPVSYSFSSRSIISNIIKHLPAIYPRCHLYRTIYWVSLSSTADGRNQRQCLCPQTASFRQNYQVSYKKLNKDNIKKKENISLVLLTNYFQA